MWNNLAITVVFVVLLLIWWGFTAGMDDKGKAAPGYDRRVTVSGIVCITVVFVALMLITSVIPRVL